MFDTVMIFISLEIFPNADDKVEAKKRKLEAPCVENAEAGEH